MKKLPETEQALVVRTDFSNPAAWEAIRSAIQEPHEYFLANVEFADDPEFVGLSGERLSARLSDDYPLSYIFLADAISMSDPEHPLLVVDISDDLGREFRAVPGEVQAIDNNLSIANMGFEEFADAVDADGVFRGFPEA